MMFSKARGVTKAVALTFGLSQLGLPGLMAQDKVMPSAQTPSVASAQATTVMVAQDQVVYETVYDTQYVQVPTTQMQTQYKTEYRTQTVPVTRVVTEQVPTTQMQTTLQDRVQDPDRSGHACRDRAGSHHANADDSTRPSTRPRPYR